LSFEWDCLPFGTPVLVLARLKKIEAVIKPF